MFNNHIDAWSFINIIVPEAYHEIAEPGKLAEKYQEMIYIVAKRSRTEAFMEAKQALHAYVGVASVGSIHEPGAATINHEKVTTLMGNYLFDQVHNK